MDVKIRHIPDKFGFRNKDAEEFPEMVVVGMSFICNARCIHCPNAATNFEATLRGKDRLMAWGVLKEIARQCASRSTLLRISSFGEILMHPQAVEMMCHVLDRKVDKNVALTTNGSMLTGEKARRLMERGMRSIEFSVDAASKEVYEKIRLGLNWERTLGNIEECLEIRDRYHYDTKVMVSVIEQPENEEAIQDILSFWEQRVDKVLIRKMLSFKGIVKRAKKYEEYMTEDAPCPFLWERVVIDPLGDVRGCVSDVNGEFRIGNVMEASLEEIWHAELIEEYREKHLSGRMKECPLCKDCVDVQYRSWKYNYFYALEENV
jgi:radical SAM protein with 4Fe4S-binding SPASM domain